LNFFPVEFQPQLLLEVQRPQINPHPPLTKKTYAKRVSSVKRDPIQRQKRPTREQKRPTVNGVDVVNQIVPGINEEARDHTVKLPVRWAFGTCVKRDPIFRQKRPKIDPPVSMKKHVTTQSNCRCAGPLAPDVSSVKREPI
jgi:hypothetical protein